MNPTPPPSNRAAPTGQHTAADALLNQSLAHGTPGIALLHIERALHGLTTWTEVHRLLASSTRDLIADDTASLYLGAPAVAFALHSAAHRTNRYTGALTTLDTQITQLTRRRLTAAHARIDQGARPRTSEFDLFYGLTGLGAYLLHRNPNTPVLREVFTYLVRLTCPLDNDVDHLPGWWTDLDPSGHHAARFPGGHGNAGMAHGAAGILSLLALGTRAGVTVPGHAEAMHRICQWLDLWRQGSDTESWWPQWITLAEHRSGTVTQLGPLRPSWCYGTPGLARAQQLAALALGEPRRQRRAEHALLACLQDPAQLGRIRDPGLCHGAAGLLHTTRRVANHSTIPGIDDHLPKLHALTQLTTTSDTTGDTDTTAGGSDFGFLDGDAGRALALLAADTGAGSLSGWDTCLLLSG